MRPGKLLAMAATTSLDNTREDLKALLDEADDGRIQVPEFQRDLILEDEWIKSLLASVSLGYPMGAVMLLQAGSPDVQFEASLLPGVPPSSTTPEWLVVDGQRRLTALYQVLAAGQAAETVQTDHDEAVHRWYYIDIDAALDVDVDRDEAIVSVPETRQLRTRREVAIDLTTVEAEWENGLFPLRLVFGADAELRVWQHGFTQHGATESTATRRLLMDRFDAEVLTAFNGYSVPTIRLAQETTRWTVRVHGGRDGRSLSDRFRITDRRLHRG